MSVSSLTPVLDPSHMLGILQRYLLPADGSPYRMQECRIVNTRRRDGSRGTAEYAVRLQHPASGRVWNQTVTGVTFGDDRTRRVWEAMSGAQTAASAASPPSVLPPFAYVPELDLLLQVFPHDHRLPAIASLMAGPTPELRATLAAEFGAGDWEIHSWTAEPVQYRVDMRAILRLSVAARNPASGDTAERYFFAKIYRDPEAAHRSQQAHLQLFARIAPTSGLLTSPRPVAYLEGLRTVVTASVPGESISKIIRRGDGLLETVQAAARATAEFHRLDIAAPPRPATDDIARLAEAEEYLSSVRPDLAVMVSEMVQNLTNALQTAPTALIHGDLKPDHILINGGRVALLDFDLIGAGDPVIDVAHLVSFLGKLEERARSRREDTGNAAQIFIEEYFARVPASWRKRLPLYHAMTSIHKAVGLGRRRGEDGLQRMESVLREGQEILAGGGAASTPTFKRRIKRAAVR